MQPENSNVRLLWSVYSIKMHMGYFVFLRHGKHYEKQADITLL